MAGKKDPKTPDPKEETPDPTPDPKADPPQADPPAKTYTQAEFDAAMKKAEKDAAKKIADAEAKAKLSEDERKDSELAETKARLAERDKRDAITEAAQAAGIKNPKLFYNAYKDELELDDKGKLKNFDDVITGAKTDSPELFGVTETPKPAGGADAGGGKTPPEALTKEKIAAMSPQEVIQNMEAIDAFLANPK